MNPRIVVAVLIPFALLGGATAAEKRVQELSWLEIREKATLPEGVEVRDDGTLNVPSSGSGPRTLTLVEIESPPIGSDFYAVRGRVRYRDVKGDAYLEMWSVFEEGHFFTRTLDVSGPLQKITGSSDWRDFGLVFDATGAAAPPSRLIVNIVLPGAGEVSLTSLSVVELDPGDFASADPARRVGLWGGIAGSVLGIAGALLGWLASAGRARTLVIAGLLLIMAAGGSSLVLGVFAVVRGAPPAVYYSFLLLGVVAILVPAAALPGIRKRYEEIELRRLSALDA
jgi:hypothetical protein